MLAVPPALSFASLPSSSAGFVGHVVPSAGVFASSASAPRAVRSWYDAGVRLSPVHSWYDDGVRLSPPGLALDQVIIQDRLGTGTQSEVLLGELPADGREVAVKVGLKRNAIAREAAVLSSMSGVPGFPTMLHHEAVSARNPGGAMVVELLGPSLDDLWQGMSQSSTDIHLSGQTFLRVGRGVLRLLRELHRAGFVHNDLKPANVLLGAGSTLQPTRLHLIDFGSCTATADDAPLPIGPIGTAMFASVAVDECQRPSCAADDVESLAYNLLYLALGALPWQGLKPDSLATSMKRELLDPTSGALDALTGELECATAATALQALWTEVRRCQSDDRGGPSVDYDACLAALSGGLSEEEAAQDDLVSEFSFVAALGEGGLSDAQSVEQEANALADISL